MDNVYMNIPKISVSNYESVWRQGREMAYNNWTDERILTFIPTVLDDFLFDAYETLTPK